MDNPTTDPFILAQEMRATLRFDAVVPHPSRSLSRKQVDEYEGSLVEAYAWTTVVMKRTRMIIAF